MIYIVKTLEAVLLLGSIFIGASVKAVACSNGSADEIAVLTFVSATLMLMWALVFLADIFLCGEEL